MCIETVCDVYLFWSGMFVESMTAHHQKMGTGNEEVATELLRQPNIVVYNEDTTQEIPWTLPLCISVPKDIEEHVPVYQNYLYCKANKHDAQN